jgi:putative ABC transport system permease protein
MIPLKYNIRNLRARATSTLLTVLSTGLVVFASCWLFGLVAGLQHSLNVSGDPLDLIILRKGSTNETDGGFEADKADELMTLAGIARADGAGPLDEKGQPLVPQGTPLAARELLHIPMVSRRDGSRANLMLRGTETASLALRPDFKLVAGRMFIPGRGECIVSKPISQRFAGARLGEVLKPGEKESYRVVGLFTAGGSQAESEVWLDRKDLERNVAREGSVSSVQIRAASQADFDAIQKTIDQETRFKLKAKSEQEVYQQQNTASLFLKASGTMIAVLLTIGAMFAAANTMFAAVSSRTREIGTMRALGFSRFSILLSFLGESVLLCALGGIVGLLATIPLNALSFSTINNFTESTFAFRFDRLVMGIAFAMTVAMGLFGGMFPALRAVRLDVIKALREL